MNENDPRSQDQFTLTFTSNRLLLAICSLLLLMVLSVMLGIRIERFQQEHSAVLAARTSVLEPAPPAAPLPAAGATPTGSAKPAAAKTTVARRLAPVKPAAVKPATAKPAASTPAPKPAAPAPIRAEDLSDTVPPPTPILLTQAAAPRLRAQPSKPTAPTRNPATRVTASRAKKYVVQVVSSRNRKQADLRARLLAVQGVPAFVESADLGAKGVWHRVLAGTFASKTEAKAALAKLQTDPQFSASFVRPY